MKTVPVVIESSLVQIKAGAPPHIPVRGRSHRFTPFFRQENRPREVRGLTKTTAQGWSLISEILVHASQYLITELREFFFSKSPNA